MKSTLIKLFTILYSILFLFESGMAQDPDYVIDINDRKIYGVVILSTPAINSSQIKFKDNQTGTTIQYRTDEIKCWFKGGSLYETKVYSISERKAFTVFMKRLSPAGGKVNLYEYYNTNGDMGYTQTFLERDNEMVEVNYGAFKKQLTEYFSDHEELSQKIAENKFKKKDILTILEEYNEWREYMWRN